MLKVGKNGDPINFVKSWPPLQEKKVALHLSIVFLSSLHFILFTLYYQFLLLKPLHIEAVFETPHIVVVYLVPGIYARYLTKRRSHTLRGPLLCEVSVMSGTVVEDIQNPSHHIRPLACYKIYFFNFQPSIYCTKFSSFQVTCLPLPSF